MARVVEFIKKIPDRRPITISEAKVAAIRDAESNFSSFIGGVEGGGISKSRNGAYSGS